MVGNKLENSSLSSDSFWSLKKVPLSQIMPGIVPLVTGIVLHDGNINAGNLVNFFFLRLTSETWASLVAQW